MSTKTIQNKIISTKIIPQFCNDLKWVLGNYCTGSNKQEKSESTASSSLQLLCSRNRSLRNKASSDRTRRLFSVYLKNYRNTFQKKKKHDKTSLHTENKISTLFRPVFLNEFKRRKLLISPREFMTWYCNFAQHETR